LMPCTLPGDDAAVSAAAAARPCRMQHQVRHATLHSTAED
jgi:hypothetical protein